MPGVSFIVTTYNDSHFLKTCLPSCFSQNIEKEIILVDDASTTPLDPYVVNELNVHKEMRLVRHTQNQGLSAARNTGIREAKYEYVIPIDADDFFHHNAVPRLFEGKEDYDIITGNCTDIGVYKPSISQGALTKEKFIENNPLVCSSLFKKSIWERVGGYMVRKGPHYEDWNFWARCFAAGAHFKYMDFEVYHHTSRADSMLRLLHPNAAFYKKLAIDGVFTAHTEGVFSKQIKIGLLVVATNKYMPFAHQLQESAKKFFLPGHEVTMFVFTDQPNVPDGAVRFEQEHLPWPGPTLKRYHMFLKHEEELSKQDYLFYSDADMRFVDTVGNEVLSNSVATMHPGFYNKPRSEFSYETRPESAAHMAPHEGYSYFAGGFNGGRSAAFLNMAKKIKEWIDSDAAKGIVAIWHDESYMNRYFFLHPPSNVLNPSYCYPESVNLPFKKKLIALDKNHHELRS